MPDKRIKKRLRLRETAGLYRRPPKIGKRSGKHIFIGNQKVLNFSSNDYLGLGASPLLGKKTAENFARYGASSSSSRLVSGNYDIISKAEEEYARYFGYESALFFPSGYQANFGLISTLFEKGDTLFFDKHIHASSVRGITASNARFFGYSHNSLAHLDRRLKTRKQGLSAVLTESLFSMDGDFLDTEGLLKLKNQHNFFCIVDEAHSFGAVGEGGRGIARAAADIAVGTLGKALGLFGAFVLVPSVVKEYLFNFASPLIYTTTLPEAHAASATDVLEFISQGDGLRQDLCQISRHMKETLTREGFKVSGDAHIIAVEIGDEELASGVSEALINEGIFAFAARFPTVPAGRAILRISMTSLHTQEDVIYFAEALKKVILLLSHSFPKCSQAASNKQNKYSEEV